ncbi:MAG: hypothetical protein DRI90_15170 [Deltaproteobacteria bacterium]|nr:MAG: hypothetical protein DRI90_15170 [Deltaproteobacteria bacterium]
MRISEAAVPALVALLSSPALAQPLATDPALPPAPADTAQPAAESDHDRFGWSIASDTYLRLFQRAMLPGPNGALVESEIAVPLYEYASLRITDIDVPWQADSVDLELSAWGNVELGEQDSEYRRVDGDLTVANLRHRVGPAQVTLGRQHYAGGAARFVRFDGLAVGLRAPLGFGVRAYGGYTVLPRWSMTSGYHLLGSVADTLVSSPDRLPDPSREDYWLAGWRVHYRLTDMGEIGVSMHEQHEASALGRRDMGADLRLTPIDELALTGQALVDADSRSPSDIRAAADVIPLDDLTVAAEYRYTVPALFLSRQSVLSVFSSDAFNEIGGSLSYLVLKRLKLGAHGYADLFDDGSNGWRTNGRARLAIGPADQLVLRLGYTRYTGPINGYHALRGAAGYQIMEPLRLTAESYGYFYDEPIRGSSAAWVGALNGEWSFSQRWATLLGGSVAITPYAEVDAQLLARLRVQLAGGER